MAICKLPEDVSALINSTAKITSPVQCVLELVLNSLDARASSIAVRIDLGRHKIQVVDNGKGMTENTLKYVGVKYMTSKYTSRVNSKYYGSRGEALANIHTVSASVVITSRCHESSDTYTKVFETGQSSKLFKDSYRPAQGTTVTVNGFLNALSLRQAYLKNNHDINLICTQVENLALANTKVSFSVRDDEEQVMVLRTHKANNPLELLEILYGNPIPASKVHTVNGGNKTGFKLNGIVGANCVQSSVIQRLFVNRRPVRCIAIRILMTRTLMKIMQGKATWQSIENIKTDNILFLLYLECPMTEYTLMIRNNETHVDFHNWKEVAKFIKTSISNASGKFDVPLPADVDSRKDSMVHNQWREIVQPRHVAGNIAKRDNNLVNLKETCMNDNFEKSNTSVPVHIEIEQSRLVAGNIAKRQKDVESVNLLMTPKNVDSLTQKQPQIFRRHETTSKKHLPKTTFSKYVVKKLRKVPFIGFPLAGERLRIYKGKPKRTILKKKYRHSCLEVPTFNRDMFKVNTLWRMAIWKQTKKQICYSNRRETVNRSRREQVRKCLDEHRRKFVDNVSAMTMCRMNMRFKQTVRVSKENVASYGNAFANLRDEQLIPPNLGISKERHDYNVSEYESIEKEEKSKKTVKRLKRSKASDNNVALELGHSNALASNYGMPRKRQDNNVSKDESMGNEVDGEKTLKRLKRITASNDDVTIKLGCSNAPTLNQGISRRHDYNVSKDELIGNEVNREKTVTWLKRTTASKDNVSIKLGHSNALASNHGMPRERKDYNLTENKSIKNEMNEEKSVTDSNRIASYDKNVMKDSNLLCSNSGILGKRQDYSMLEDTNHASIGIGVEDESTSRKFKDGCVFFSNLDTSRISKGNNFFSCTNHGYNGKGIGDGKTKPFPKGISPIGDVLKQLRDLTELSSHLGISRKGQTDYLAEDNNHKNTEKKNERVKGELQNVFEKSSVNNQPGDSAIDLEDMGNSNVDWSSWYAESIPELQANALSQKNIIDNELAKICGYNPGDRLKNIRQYSFVPATLNALLNATNNRLTNKMIFNHCTSNDDFRKQVLVKQDRNIDTLHRRQDMDVRLCTTGTHFREFTLGKESLKHMQVLGQMNKEFIVALTQLDGRSLLVIMDQHAVDERIRYETLLREYTLGKKNMFVAVKLESPIAIYDFTVYCSRLLLANKKILEMFGMEVKAGIKGHLIIDSVPKCFANKRFFENDAKLVTAVRKLLQEIMKNLISNRGLSSVVPAAIHHAIAMEACRGAVKFGDPLTLEQCKQLVESLENTNAPGRCAHGRPSFVPLLDLMGLEKQAKSTEGKLNFASLRKRRWKLHKKTIKQTRK